MLRSTFCLLALSAAAFAGPATDLRPLEPDHAPAAYGHAPAGVAVGRGVASARGVTLSTVDNLDSLALQPAILNLQLSSNTWSDGSITGRSLFRGTTVSSRIAYAVADDVAGNATPKVRLMATAPVSPDQFFFGFRYELLRTNAPLVRLPLRPDIGQPARFEHDLFVTTVETLWTSEAISVTDGTLVDRLQWGGNCLDCGGPVLPPYDPDQILMLGFNPGSFLTGIFHQCRWIDSAPALSQPGEFARMPAGTWVRVRHESTADGMIVASMDVNDGTGFHRLYSAPYLTIVHMDSLGANGSYEVPNAPAYYDNFTAEGVEFTLPTFPQALECGQSGYLDDVQWLHPGPLGRQTDLWFDALSSKAIVDVEAGDKAIRQTNLFPDNHHREEFTRTLPEFAAFHGAPLSLCQETRLSPGAVTVRAVAPVSFLENSFVTRVSLGHWDPNASPPFSSRVFVQHNAAYDPNDEEGSEDPFQPGPNGNGGVARIGGAATIGDPDYDYYDSGVALVHGEAAALCILVDHDRAMTISYAGVPVSGSGSGVAIEAFASSISEVRYESENQEEGAGDSFWIDDVFLNCSLCPTVSLPPFWLPHIDNLEWAIAGIDIGVNDDDCNPTTEFRWTSAPGMPVVDLGAKSQALRMENLLRNQTQTAGDFTLVEQASTRIPHVSPSAARGYAVGAWFKFTDGATTRAWIVGEDAGGPGASRPNAALLYSAGSGTLWALKPDPLDPVASPPQWVDTGRTLAEVGAAPGGWFRLTTHRNLDGSFIFKVNASVLTDSAGAVVRVAPLQSLEGGVHEDLDRLVLLSGDDATAPAGSILYADNIRAWALPCLGDTNDDGVVSFADLNNILGAFNSAIPPTTAPNVAPDADGDGVADDGIVNFADLNAALAQFGTPCD